MGCSVPNGQQLCLGLEVAQLCPQGPGFTSSHGLGSSVIFIIYTPEDITSCLSCCSFRDLKNCPDYN